MPGRSSAMYSLSTDLTCPVCLEYYSDPVTLACGHSFCLSCISRCWERPYGSFSCPVCRQNFTQRTLKRNQQLGEAVQRLHTQRAQSSRGCECTKKQHENLKLFCRNDESLLCVVCDRSQDHRSHNMIPIEEAAQEYKNKVESEKRKVVVEFAQLRQLLDEQEKILLIRLDAVGMKLSKTESRIASRLSTETSSLQKLVQETKEMCQKPAAEFLKNVKSAIMRCETVRLPQPNVSLMADRSDTLVRRPSQDSQLSSSCILLKEISQQFKEDVTLDGKTANPYLVVYENGKRVKRCDTKQDMPDNPERFDSDPCILACEGFTSGRHYWEVEVEDGRYWAVGVTKESVRRKGGIRAIPEEGIWAIGLYWNQYRALTSAVTHLSPSQGLKKVGLFLDYDLGQITFYNAESMEHVYTFHHRFTEKIFPLVWVWSTETRIKLSP
ncbi:E3 ubiquitin-protein ligase TRIM39 isoform X2 [Microcaecilia unicolor]|uniref:E3 ubiquitin-protein ligase TRIM39-like isoform X2 n=1 Tax=Microcaecilia unicolor TaxID=1415580 RepID=A0A6P7XLD2_9AMPH|nr:E3 ubiquitin-protein ligase TRIM39-like isoform X2 [Microcaecilia unicolor]